MSWKNIYNFPATAIRTHMSRFFETGHMLVHSALTPTNNPTSSNLGGFLREARTGI